MNLSEGVLESFHRVLVEEIASKRPEYLEEPFTVAEIYQDLVPYSTHRDRIGVDINGDYEDALIRMLAGEGGYLVLESEHALRDLRRELEARNPNTGVYREYAAVDVRLNPERVRAVPAVAGRMEEREESDGAEAHAANGARPHAEGVADIGPSHDEAPSPGSGPRSAAEAGPSAPGGERLPSASAVDGACRWCRATLPEREDLKYCPYCGTDVRAVPCPGCGQELEPDWRFCIACGTEVRT